MELKHLEYFSVIAQYGSINKAAQMLYVSQPRLSHIIKELEADVGAKLLMRIPTGVALTPEGELFLQHIHTILGEARVVRELFRKPAPMPTALRISMTKFSHVMESFIDFCKEYEAEERFSFFLNEGSPLDVIRDVADGTANLGVLHFDRAQKERYQALWTENRLSYQPLSVCRPHIVLRREHPLIGSGSAITPEALRCFGFARYIGHHEDFMYNLLVDGEETDFTRSERIAYIYGRATLMHLLSASDFYTIGIQGFDCQQQIYNVVSLPIPGCKSELEFGYIQPDSGAQPPGGERFLRHLRNRLRPPEGLKEGVPHAVSP